MDKETIVREILKLIFGSGFIAFTYKWIRQYRKRTKDEKTAKENDRILFLKLVDEVQEIKVDVKGIKAKIRKLDDNARNKLNAQGIAFWESDKNGNAVIVSPALQVMIGQPSQKIEGSGWMSLVVERDRERIKRAWKFSIETMTVFDEIYSFNSSGGYEVKVHSMSYHNKDEDGKYEGSFGQLKLYDNGNDI